MRTQLVYSRYMPPPPVPKLFLSHAYADRGYFEGSFNRILLTGCGLDEDLILHTPIRSNAVSTEDDLFAYRRETAEVPA